MSPQVSRGRPKTQTDCAKPKGGTVTVRRCIRRQKSSLRKRAFPERSAEKTCKDRDSASDKPKSSVGREKEERQ